MYQFLPHLGSKGYKTFAVSSLHKDPQLGSSKLPVIYYNIFD